MTGVSGIMAFDVIMPQGIPGKGRVLTAVATHWFQHTEDILENHLVSTDVEGLPHHGELSDEERALLRGRMMLVRKACHSRSRDASASAARNRY